MTRRSDKFLFVVAALSVAVAPSSPVTVVARVQQALGVVEQERRRSVLRPGVRDLVI